MDVLTLARLQFALTIAFHYLFPPLFDWPGIDSRHHGRILSRHKTRAVSPDDSILGEYFRLVFAIGVVSGIVMEFQFGMKPGRRTRDLSAMFFGSALAAEGIFAFFLESGFLAILLFGWIE